MFPGLPSRMEKEMKQLYLQRVLKGDTSRMDVNDQKKFFKAQFYRFEIAKLKNSHNFLFILYFSP